MFFDGLKAYQMCTQRNLLCKLALVTTLQEKEHRGVSVRFHARTFLIPSVTFLVKLKLLLVKRVQNKTFLICTCIPYRGGWDHSKEYIFKFDWNTFGGASFAFNIELFWTNILTNNWIWDLSDDETLIPATIPLLPVGVGRAEVLWWTVYHG